MHTVSCDLIVVIYELNLVNGAHDFIFWIVHWFSTYYLLTYYLLSVVHSHICEWNAHSLEPTSHKE